jgi:hypothetical protein
MHAIDDGKIGSSTDTWDEWSGSCLMDRAVPDVKGLCRADCTDHSAPTARHAA